MNERRGSQEFAGVQALDLALSSAAVSVHLHAAPDVRVEWRIYCRADQNGCDPSQRELRFDLQAGRLGVTEVPPPATQAPQMELDIHTPDGVEVTANLQNGVLNLSIPQTFHAIISNGVVTAEGDRRDPCALDIANGSVTTDWRLLDGDHTIKVGQGSATIALRPGTSCRYRATVRHGTLTVGRRIAMLGGSVEGTIGGGAGNLDLEVGLGSAVVDTP